MLTIGSLFSGIGGLELGLEWAGLGPVIWQAESDPFCREVLARHWPGVRRYDDVREIDGEAKRPDIICGGFPCQDISDASRGRGKGIAGDRSGLYREIVRIASALRPRWVILENTDGAAWGKWVPVVRRELHCIGFPSVPFRVCASGVGAPFKGSRIFVVAAPYGESESTSPFDAKVAELPASARACWSNWGQPSSRALGMADGIPNRMERLEALGNAVVPQCAEVVGHALVEIAEMTGRI